VTDPKPYQVLARKYRPALFKEVVGQEGVVATLCNAIEKERLHHAYLFSGTRGVGKTTLARLFARALNCAAGPTTEPCGTCEPCREIASGTSMDVIEIDGASNRKVEDVDPLREAARYAPARDRHKIFIIDEVHMLSETAFNALLKILEEPPPRTLFLFATTEPEEVPDTILSRCLHLACRRVPRDEISGALQRTAAAEKLKCSREACDLIAGLAAGSMRDGLSLLDQVIAFGGGDVSLETVRDGLGLIDRGIVTEFVDAIGRQDAPAALSLVERLSEGGSDLTHFCREALALVRDVMVVKTAGAAQAAALGLSVEEAASCESLSGAFTSDGLLRLTQAMLDLNDRIRRSEHPRYLLEASALRMIRLADLTPIEDLIRALEAGATPGSAPGGGNPPAGGHRSRNSTASPGLPFDASGRRRATGNGGTDAPAATPPPPSASDVPAGGAAASRVVERVAARKVSLGTFLSQAGALDIEGDTLFVTIHQRQAFLETALQTPENLALIRDEAAAVAGRPLDVKVRFEAPPSDDLAAIAGEAEKGGAAGRQSRLMDEALKEPVVRTVMDMFKGRIVDIREVR